MNNELIKEYVNLILEVPIGDFEVIGKPMTKKGGGFDPRDRKLLASERAVQKIKRKWEKTPYVFDMYLLKVPALNKAEFREIGVVEPGGNFAQLYEKHTGQTLPNNSSSITILFNGNFGAEKVPMTAWVMAHRFGHAVRKIPDWGEYIQEVVELTKRILNEIYDETMNHLKKSGIVYTEYPILRNRVDFERKLLSLFYNQLGTFKSAREGKITRYYEFFYELFAQYIITGSVKFKPLEKNIVIQNLPFGRKQMKRAVDDDLLDMWNRDLEIYADQIESRIINVLESAVGKTFLM